MASTTPVVLEMSNLKPNLPTEELNMDENIIGGLNTSKDKENINKDKKIRSVMIQIKWEKIDRLKVECDYPKNSKLSDLLNRELVNQNNLMNKRLDEAINRDECKIDSTKLITQFSSKSVYILGSGRYEIDITHTYPSYGILIFVYKKVDEEIYTKYDSVDRLCDNQNNRLWHNQSNIGNEFNLHNIQLIANDRNNTSHKYILNEEQLNTVLLPNKLQQMIKYKSSFIAPISIYIPVIYLAEIIIQYFDRTYYHLTRMNVYAIDFNNFNVEYQGSDKYTNNRNVRGRDVKDNKNTRDIKNALNKYNHDRNTNWFHNKLLTTRNIYFNRFESVKLAFDYSSNYDHDDRLTVEVMCLNINLLEMTNHSYYVGWA